MIDQLDGVAFQVLRIKSGKVFNFFFMFQCKSDYTIFSLSDRISGRKMIL